MKLLREEEVKVHVKMSCDFPVLWQMQTLRKPGTMADNGSDKPIF
jgi:hypothetical protein